jgi:hypothetical protein
MTPEELTPGPIFFSEDFVASYLFPLVSFFGLTNATSPDEFMSVLYSIWQVFSFVSLAFSALLLYGIIYAKIRYAGLHHKVVHKIEHAEEQYAQEENGYGAHDAWSGITDHLNSQNPNDWRLAVIEADIMLEAALERAGFPGVTIGEKLKQANKNTFRSLQDAWQAHKVRNDIAHTGNDFVLTKRIADETLMRYKKVFDELGG